MLTPQQVSEAYARADLDVMMQAIREVAARAERPNVIMSPANYAAQILHTLGRKNREEFWVTTLNNASEIIQTHQMYTGTIYASNVRLTEIFRLVILDDATMFIVAHNHPASTGGITPSNEDIQVTRNIYKVAALLGCPLMDHVIVAPGQWYSMAEHGLLTENKNVRKTEVQRAASRPRPDGTRPE